MKVLYLDCGMGAAGDMLTAALLELFSDREAMVAKLNALGIPGVRYVPERSVKCGITGTHMSVEIDGREEESFHHHHHGEDHGHGHGHSHGGMGEIRHLIAHLALPEAVRGDILGVYESIARAESQVHGVEVDQIHFHEVGSMDAVADVTAVCYLLHELGVDRISASGVHVGSGKVHCAHGLLPVPAPATAVLLQGIPIYGGEIQGELCTPTGAALLKHFVKEFGPMPPMVVEATGYGMGKKDFPAANCVRAMVGTDGAQGDSVWELSCNLDDMTAEDIGFAMEQLLICGALDVFTTAIGMKKNRPGTMLTVLCTREKHEGLVQAIFANTTTLGIRESERSRYTLTRREERVETPYGVIRRKVAQGYGVTRSKPEYDDLARIAWRENLSLTEVRRAMPADNALRGADEI